MAVVPAGRAGLGLAGHEERARPSRLVVRAGAALIDDHVAARSLQRSRALLQRLCAAHGIEPVRPHDLRRTCLTVITRLGFSRDAMDRINNHKDGRVRDVYDRHGYGREDATIMDAIARHATGIVDGGETDDVVVRLR